MRAMIASTKTLEYLEPRRLLSFALFGTDTLVAEDASASDVATASDGSFIVASQVSLSATKNVIQVASYSASGVQVGSAITIDPIVSASVNSLSIAMDDAGDAVVAYQLFSADFFG